MSAGYPTPENMFWIMCQGANMSVSEANFGNCRLDSWLTVENGAKPASLGCSVTSSSSAQKLAYHSRYMWGYTSRRSPSGMRRDPRLPPSHDFCSYSVTE